MGQSGSKKKVQWPLGQQVGSAHVANDSKRLHAPPHLTPRVSSALHHPHPPPSPGSLSGVVSVICHRHAKPQGLHGPRDVPHVAPLGVEEHGEAAAHELDLGA